MNDIELIKKYQETGCIKSRNKVVENNLQLAKAYHTRHHSAGTSFTAADLLQQAYIGLINSLVSFDTTKGLSTYAYFHMQSEVVAYIRANHSMMPCGNKTSNHRKILSNLSKLNVAQADITQRDVDEFATSLGVMSDEVMEVLCNTSEYDDIYNDSLDKVVENTVTNEDYCSRLMDALNILSSLEYSLVKEHYWEEATYAQLSKKHKIAMSTVYYNMQRAFKKIKEVLEG